jgi:hypothetical protein
MEDKFYVGFVYGLMVGGILGYILSNIRAARTKMGTKNRPLDSFPDAIQPNLTPAKIVRNSRMAMFSCIFWFGLLIVAIYTFIVLTPYVRGMP